MGRGIEIRGKGIRVNFRWRGRLQRETLDLKPTPANIKYAERLVQDIKEHIRHGTFDYAEFFPTKGKRRRIRKADPTFKDIAERWLATLTVASSTRRSYEVAICSTPYRPSNARRCAWVSGALGRADLGAG